MARPTTTHSTPRAYGGIDGGERRADRRRRLIEAGLDLLAEGGPAAITVTGVCRRASLTARYFYEHFPNRDALLSAIVETEADMLIDIGLGAALSAGSDPQARGEAAVRAVLGVLDADPRAVRVSREQGEDEVVLRMRAAIAARLSASFAQNAELMWPSAAKRPERVAMAASLTVGGVLQIITDWLDDTSALSREELVRIAAQFVVTTGDVVLS